MNDRPKSPFEKCRDHRCSVQAGPGKRRRGAMLVLVAVTMIILLLGAAFSIDIAYIHMVRAELRTATDAAARAGAETLARTQDQDLARARAIELAAMNSVGGQALTLTTDDIQLGSVQSIGGGRYDFIEGAEPLIALRIHGHRDASSPDGPVNLFFGRVFTAFNFAPSETATAASSVRDVALVLDVSGSMKSSGGGGKTRLKALQDAVDAFLDEIGRSSPATQVSVTTYSSDAKKVHDLTKDFKKIKGSNGKLKAAGMTAVGRGLQVGSDSLEFDATRRPYANKTVIVMTDGNHNTGVHPLDVVPTAANRNQTVHTITFGSGADQNLMQQVAEATEGGFHLHADDADDLTSVFEEIARTLAVVLVE